MKLKLFSLLLFSIGLIHAQDSHGTFEIRRNKQENLSISREQQDLIWQKVQSNVHELKRRGIMNNNTVNQRVAAAAAILVYKDVLNLETNCGETPNNFFNVITIRHNNGNYAKYYGIKDGTTTSKIVGDAVVASEVLRALGNAGSSKPELYFRLLDTAGISMLDPSFFETCNTTTVDS